MFRQGWNPLDRVPQVSDTTQKFLCLYARKCRQRALFIFSMPVMTRYLPPEEYGTLSLVNTVTAILMTFFGLGLHDYAMRFYYEREAETERKRLMGSVWAFLVLFALTASLFLSFCGGLIFQRLFKEISFSPYMLIGIWTCFAASFETIPDACSESETRHSFLSASR